MFPSQKSDVALGSDAVCGASMGPGCFHPRNAKVQYLVVNAAQLQWGRDVSIPEMECWASGHGDTHRLQWGRDVSIPEIWMPYSPSPLAAWLQWGRDVSIPEMKSFAVTCRLNALLQWGRDVSIPEITPCRAAPRAKPDASMGPGCFHPRNAD